MITKIKKYGNKFIAPIPNELKDEYSLKEGDYLDLDFLPSDSKVGDKTGLKIIVKGIFKKHTT